MTTYEYMICYDMGEGSKHVFSYHAKATSFENAIEKYKEIYGDNDMYRIVGVVPLNKNVCDGYWQWDDKQRNRECRDIIDGLRDTIAHNIGSYETLKRG